jgi:hypothetical protein
VRTGEKSAEAIVAMTFRESGKERRAEGWKNKAQEGTERKPTKEPEARRRNNYGFHL